MYTRYQSRHPVLGLLTGVAWLLALPSASYAAGTVRDDFWVCDGLTGVALGLCNGAAASRCLKENAGTAICLAMEERYRRLTGKQDVPWIYLNYPVQSAVVDDGQYIDLETGQLLVDSSGILVGPRGAMDLGTAFDGTEPPVYLNPFRLLASPITCSEPGDPRYGQPLDYAFLNGTPFGAVSPSTIDGTTFVSGVGDAQFMPVMTQMTRRLCIPAPAITSRLVLLHAMFWTRHGRSAMTLVCRI